jgi:glycosyltransferase involved in cell wall biosynthesis
VIPQPVSPTKGDYVLHLGSREPHKRTAWLVRQWLAAKSKRDLPQLHVVGNMPPEVIDLARSCPSITTLPFLDDAALRSQFEAARALVFPSEIEGFGLPAVEAYYLGTPVCFTAGTSIEEVVGAAGRRGGFDLKDPASLFDALDDVLRLSAGEVHASGLILREKYAARVVVDTMVSAFRRAARTV